MSLKQIPVDASKSVKKISSDSIVELIKKRKTNEIVVAVCGAIGSGISDVINHLSTSFASLDYEVRVLKASHLIIDRYESERAYIGGLDKVSRVLKLQNFGNELREKYGNDAIAQFVIQDIRLERSRWASENPDVDNRRYVTIVDSLKHPSEAELLSIVYGDMFYLFGVLCPEETRLERLRLANFGEKAQFIIDRDEDEDVDYGQKLLDTIHLSDFFVNNSAINSSALQAPINRFVRLLLSDKSYVPTTGEYAMFVAQSAAMRSACMSRQVGAAIFNKDGDVVSTGRNDVPKCGGGMYAAEDSGASYDARCMHIRPYVCYNDKYKKEIKEKIRDIISTKLDGVDGIGDFVVSKIVSDIYSNARIKTLIEFSRAIHAEMDAITTAARNGFASLRGAEMFVTTFPCHHCARHIVASGIKRVYYIEPYGKSLASELHFDSISIEKSDARDESTKVKIIPFQGVAPRKYLQFFSAKTRKVDGKKIDFDCRRNAPVCEKYLDTHFTYEEAVIRMLAEKGEVDVDPTVAN